MKIDQILIIGVAFTLFACGNKSKESKESSDLKVTETPVFKGEGLKIGFYYADSLSESYLFIKEATKSMETKVNQLSNAFQSKVTNFQNWANTQNEKAQKGLLLSAEVQKFQQESQERQYNLEQEQQQLQMKIQDIQNENLSVAVNRVEDFVHRYAKENGYDLILQYSKGGQVAFANPEMDITADIVAGLNKEHQESQTKK